MGKTPPVARVQNADDMLAMLLQLIRQEIGDQPFCVAGQSYGGYLALGLLHELREQIDGALLLCPAVIADQTNRQLPSGRCVRKESIAHKPEEAETFQDFMELAVVATPESWRRYREEILPGLQSANADFTARYQREGYALSFECDFPGMTYDKPVCVITGRQDSVVGFIDTWEISKRFSRATFAVLDEAGHNLQLERTALFDALVRDWMARLSS